MGGCWGVERTQWVLNFEYGYLKSVDRTFSQCHIHPKCWTARIPLKLCNHPDIGEFYSEGPCPPLPTQLWLNLFLFGTVSGASASIMHACSVTNLCPALVTPRAPLTLGFPKEEYRSGLPFFFFSRGSSWLRHRTQISCIGRWVLYHWATREASVIIIYNISHWHPHPLDSFFSL